MRLKRRQQKLCLVRDIGQIIDQQDAAVLDTIAEYQRADVVVLGDENPPV